MKSDLHLNHKYWLFAVGIAIGLGTTRLSPIADLLLVYFVLIRMRLNPIPHTVLIWLATLSLPFLVAGFFNDVATVLYTLIHLWILAFAVVQLRGRVRKAELWMGLSVSFLVHLSLLGLQQFHVLNYQQAPHGFTYNSGLLATIAFAFLPVAGLFSVPVLVLTLSRTNLLLVAVTAVVFRRWIWLAVPVTIGIVALVTLTPTRLNPVPEIHNRVRLNSPDISDAWKWQGLGFGKYNAVFELPTPHNVWVASFWELGVFSVLFWIGTLVVIVKHKLWAILPVLATGFTTEDVWSWDSGHYALAIGFLSWREIIKRQWPSWSKS